MKKTQALIPGDFVLLLSVVFMVILALLPDRDLLRCRRNTRLQDPCKDHVSVNRRKKNKINGIDNQYPLTMTRILALPLQAPCPGSAPPIITRDFTLDRGGKAARMQEHLDGLPAQTYKTGR